MKVKTKRKIILYPDPVLRQKTEFVKEVTSELLEAMDEMREILMPIQNGAGLAAPQVGIVQRFFALKSEDRKSIDFFINPRITATVGEKVYPKLIDDRNREEDFLEGCLSFPNFWGTVKRYLIIEAEWEEIKDGKLVTKHEKLKGLQAIVFQHESDHLDGVLFVDHVKNEGGKFYKDLGNKMAKWSVEKVIEGNL